MRRRSLLDIVEDVVASGWIVPVVVVVIVLGTLFLLASCAAPQPLGDAGYQEDAAFFDLHQEDR